MSSSCTLTSAVQDSHGTPLCIVSKNVLVSEQPKFLRNWCFFISMEKRYLYQQWEPMRWKLWRGTSFSTTGNGYHSTKVVLLQSFSGDYFFDSLSHVGNHTVALAGWRGYFPHNFTKMGTRLHCTVEWTMVSTVTVIKSCYLQTTELKGSEGDHRCYSVPWPLPIPPQSSEVNFLAAFDSLSALESSVSAFLYQSGLAARGNHKSFNIEKGSDYLNLLSVTWAVLVYAPCFLLSPDVQLCRVMHTNCS